MLRKKSSKKKNHYLGFSDQELKRLRMLYVKGNNEESRAKNSNKDEKKKSV